MKRNEGKKGQRVKLTAGRDEYGLRIGDVGTLIQDNDGAPFALWDRVGEKFAIAHEDLELVPTITIEPGKHYRLRNGKVTGRVSTGDIGFEALVDGQMKVFDKAGGAVFGGEDIVEAWVPKVGERVVEADGKHYDLVRHWRDYWQNSEGPLTDKSFVVTKIYGEQVHYSNRAGGAGPQIEVRFLEPLLVAAPAQQAVLKIEAGRYYKTRDGRKVGPMADNGPAAPLWPWSAFGYGNFCRGDGTVHYGDNKPHEDDLIAEWIDERVAVAASNDNVAKPKFKVGDLVRTDGSYTFDPNVGEVTSIEDDYINVKVDNDGYGGGLWAYDEGELASNVAPQHSTAGFTIPLVDEEPETLTLMVTADTAQAEAAFDRIIAKLERIAELQAELGLRAA